MAFGTHEYDRVAIQLSENKVHDVVAHFLVHDVVALITYCLLLTVPEGLERDRTLRLRPRRCYKFCGVTLSPFPNLSLTSLQTSWSCFLREALRFLKDAMGMVRRGFVLSRASCLAMNAQ